MSSFLKLKTHGAAAMIEKYNHSNWNTFNSISSSERIIGCWKISAQYNLGHFVSHRFSNCIICQVLWKRKAGKRKKKNTCSGCKHCVMSRTTWIYCVCVCVFSLFGGGMDCCGNHCSTTRLALLKINGNLFFFFFFFAVPRTWSACCPTMFRLRLSRGFSPALNLKSHIFKCKYKEQTQC